MIFETINEIGRPKRRRDEGEIPRIILDIKIGYKYLGSYRDESNQQND